jgi:exodeoxyribonuclease-3
MIVSPDVGTRDTGEMTIRLLSWNVNGIRAAYRKGFADWVASTSPDVLSVQELKAQEHQLGQGFDAPDGYSPAWSFAEGKSYSGVATFSKQEPVRVEQGFGIDRFDTEGRTVVTEFPGFVLYNIYFPNGQSGEERLAYKLDFYDALLDHARGETAKGKKLIVCGDYNTAHEDIDLARSKENEKNSGFLRVERDWLDRWEAEGFVDTFRHYNAEPDWYSYWDQKSRARDRNVGWRIDYFFVHRSAMDAVTGVAIHTNVMGSDHCPIELRLDASLL